MNCFSLVSFHSPDKLVKLMGCFETLQCGVAVSSTTPRRCCVDGYFVVGNTETRNAAEPAGTSLIDIPGVVHGKFGYLIERNLKDNTFSSMRWLRESKSKAKPR
jgi:hypothetical protein